MAITTEAFTSQIEERMAHPGDNADFTTTFINLPGTNSEVTIRNQGAYILEAVLTGDSGQPVPVLFADENDMPNKINASHVMAPAGKSTELGGQHGVWRWADYDAEYSQSSALLTAETPEKGMRLTRAVQLNEEDPGELTLFTELTNDSDQPVETSFGEHLYFRLRDGDIEGFKMGTHLGLGGMKEMPQVEDVMNGDARVWEAYSGEIFADFPDGKRVKMTSEVTLFNADDTLSDEGYDLALWMWHRRGSELLCLEPVVGTKGFEDNKRLRIGVGCTASLKTVISLY